MSNRVITKDDVEPARGTSKRGYVTALNGKPLLVWLTTLAIAASCSATGRRSVGPSRHWSRLTTRCG